MPALAQTKPCVGLDDQDAALGAQHLAALVEDQLDQRRLFAEHGGEPARLGAGHHRGELRTRPSALETTFWETTTTSPLGELGSARRSARRALIPSLELGQAGDRGDPQLVGARRSYPQRPGRARARGPGRASSSRVSAIRSAGVSRSSPSEASSSTAEGDAGLAGGGDVAGAAALAEGRARSRPAGSARARWSRSPWRSGTIADVALRHAGQQPVELARVEQRAVAGQQDDAARRPRPRPGRSRPAPPRRGRRRSGSGDDLGTGRRRRAPARPGSPLTTIVRSIAARLADRLEHVGRPSPRPAPGAARRSSPAARRCLAASKRLTGRMAVAFNSSALAEA